MAGLLIVYTRSYEGIRGFHRPGMDALSEALALHTEHPRHAIGLFEDATGKTGEAWFFYPEEVEALRWYGSAHQ